MVTSACQSWTSILVTLPTLTSATRTREFCWMLSTSGNCAWMVYEPAPPPSVPGRGSEFRPRHSPHPDIADRPRDQQAAAHATPPRRRIMIRLRAAPSCPCSPSAGIGGDRRLGRQRRASGQRRVRAGAPCRPAAAHGRRRLRRNVVGPHPVLAVGDLVRPRRAPDEQVLTPSGGKLYWRFLMIGARYCTHSFADCSAPSRDAAWIALQMN